MNATMMCSAPAMQCWLQEREHADDAAMTLYSAGVTCFERLIVRLQVGLADSMRYLVTALGMGSVGLAITKRGLM